MTRAWNRTLRVAAFVPLAALAAAGCAAWSEDATPARGERYPGALFLFQMEQVTVVYPTQPASGREIAEASARRRAEHLRRHFGVAAEVAPDASLIDTRPRGNLLILGWNNRLLRDGLVETPFRRDSRGLEFLGLRLDRPDLDLLFFYRSPFDPEHYVVFWSRIDPERDRFQVLPRVGSDWAILEDYTVLAQGMFRPGTQWPPIREPRAEGRHRDKIDGVLRRMITRESGPVRLHGDRGIPAESLEAMLEARVGGYRQAAAFLGLQEPFPRLEVYVYAASEDKEIVTGVRDPAHALPWKRQIHMLPRYARTPSPHEEIHVLARERFGPCSVTAMYEGLALDAEGRYRGEPLEVHAALALEAKSFPSVDTLLNDERLRALPDETAYPASGLLVRWIRERRGMAGLEEAYTLPQASSARLARLLELKPRALEKQFRAWVEDRVRAHRDDVAFLEMQQKAHAAFLEGDYAGVAESLRQALRHRPDDPQTLFNLASALMRTGEYAEAERWLRRLLELPLERGSRFRIFGHYQLGRVLDLQHRREEALREYRKVLELPDQHDAHLLAREAMEQPVTPEQIQ